MLHWKQLVTRPDHELRQFDIAEVHLACAAGLPGAGKIDPDGCLKFLNYAAGCVSQYTEEQRPRFLRKPEDYRSSEAYFRALCLVTALWRGLGVRYNPAKIPPDAPWDLADTFIYGAIFGHGGTCATLPIVYAAVGRRLGYPIKLASAYSKETERAHCFARWEEPGGERFNIEVNETGMSSPPDDHYRTGRYAVTPDEERWGCLVRSKTPKEELADFLAERGCCWLALHRYRYAANAFAWAWALSPENRFLKNRLITTVNAWGEGLKRREPPGFPAMYFTWPRPRRFLDTLPLDYEKDILCLEAQENTLNNPEHTSRFWEPMRRGQPVNCPTTAVIVFREADQCDIGLHFGSGPAQKYDADRRYNPVTGRWQSD